MTRKADWEKFFDSHALVYMENCFTQNTVLDSEADADGGEPSCRILTPGSKLGRLLLRPLDSNDTCYETCYPTHHGQVQTNPTTH